MADQDAAARDVDISRDEALALVALFRDLGCSTEIAAVARRVCTAVRGVVGADGVTFVLSEGDQVYYAAEDARERLWEGRRFPIGHCISGWTVTHGEPAVIEDVFADERVPAEAYRPTFVRSLATMPLGLPRTLGCLGAYWSERRRATERDLYLLEIIACAVGQAVARADLERQVTQLRKALPQGADAPPGAGPERSSMARLLAVVAHDLKNPIAAVRNALDVVERRETLSERGTQMINLARRSALSARRMIDEIVTFARLQDRTAFPLRLQPARLDALCRAALEEVGAALPGREIRFESVPVTGQWDPDRLNDVLTNLVRNAVQHGDPAGPVNVTVRADADVATVTVHNRGEPIPPGLLPRLFDPYARAAQDTRSVGLGLYIAAEVARAHGGRIDVTSTAAEGTTFVLRLPLGAAPLPPGSAD